MRRRLCWLLGHRWVRRKDGLIDFFPWRCGVCGLQVTDTTGWPLDWKVEP